MPSSKPADTSVAVHDLIRERWSPRAFADRSVSGEDLVALLEAARWAASSSNLQPWHYIVATRDDPGEFQRMVDCLMPGNQDWAPQAPVLMISVAKMNRDSDRPNRHAFHDTGAASAQLTAEASARGLVVHQMGGIEVDRIREVYALPEGFEPVAGIAVGYQGEPDNLPEKRRESETAPRTRKPLSEMVFKGRFGQASPLVG